MLSYPLDRLHEEVAFIAVGLGWSYHEILALTHQERARWVRQVNRIHNRHNQWIAQPREEA
ncbi:MAG: hypothetical protein K8J31_18770 [Anaerolineae bacterium]|nr:hypothetical protein [Anaerolineae bacterium]